MASPWESRGKKVVSAGQLQQKTQEAYSTKGNRIRDEFKSSGSSGGGGGSNNQQSSSAPVSENIFYNQSQSDKANQVKKAVDLLMQQNFAKGFNIGDRKTGYYQLLDAFGGDEKKVNDLVNQLRMNIQTRNVAGAKKAYSDIFNQALPGGISAFNPTIDQIKTTYPDANQPYYNYYTNPIQKYGSALLSNSIFSKLSPAGINQAASMGYGLDDRRLISDLVQTRPDLYGAMINDPRYIQSSGIDRLIQEMNFGQYRKERDSNAPLPVEQPTVAGYNAIYNPYLPANYTGISAFG